MLAPQVFVLNTWEHPIDPFASSRRRIIKDKSRRVMIESTSTLLTLKMERRYVVDTRYPVKENLWRLVPGYSDWIEQANVPIVYGKGEFEIDGYKFSYALDAVNNKQVRFNTVYESWNVFAERCGQLAYRFAIGEKGSSSEN